MKLVRCGQVDESLRKLVIHGSSIKAGRNEITLTCNYSEDHHGLESIFLLGDFGRTMLEKPSILNRNCLTALSNKTFYLDDLVCTRSFLPP